MWERKLNELADRPGIQEDYIGKSARIYGKERAVLVALQKPGGSVKESLAELGSLASTAGIPTLLEVVQARKSPDPSYFIGKGKASEVKAACQELGADVVIFNDELTPAQARNLESKLRTKVIDRSQLILDIFAQRAATKEARLQVELAQLRYLLPRLRGWGSALSRLGGGIGTRGPGETRLELDRKKINNRIHRLEKSLQKAKAERKLRGKRRRAGPIPVIVLVGYTNSGKSTLLNLLSNAHVLVEDKLFATLTTTVRRGQISASQRALFVDTVGFIRSLPHQLIPAFAATLEAIREADLILHVVDASRVTRYQDYQTVISTIDQEVFLDDQPRPTTIDVLNKIDLVDRETLEIDGFHEPVMISAREGTNIDGLQLRIQHVLSQGKQDVCLILPYGMGQQLHSLSRRERVQVCSYTKEGIEVDATLSKQDVNRLIDEGARLSPSAAVK